MALHSEAHQHDWPLQYATDEPAPLRPEPVFNVRGDIVGLGPLRPELLSTYVRWLNDFELLAMLDRRFRPLTPDWIRTWYERVGRGNGDTLIFTIWDIATSTPIGNAALQDIDLRSRTAEFGVFIAESGFRSGGRGTEAVNLMLRFAFETLDLENVMLRAFTHNRRPRSGRSVSVLANLGHGMRRPGRVFRSTSLRTSSDGSRPYDSAPMRTTSLQAALSRGYDSSGVVGTLR